MERNPEPAQIVKTNQSGQRRETIVRTTLRHPLLHSQGTSADQILETESFSNIYRFRKGEISVTIRPKLNI